jgi:hypothetical protein
MNTSTGMSYWHMITDMSTTNITSTGILRNLTVTYTHTRKSSTAILTIRIFITIMAISLIISHPSTA